MHRKIIFVGPQGSGKSTLATLLQVHLNTDVCYTKLDLHAYLSNILGRFLFKLVRNNITYEKFYTNIGKQKSLSPKLLSRLFNVYVLIYFISVTLSSIAMCLHSLRNRSVLIEDEGFVFKALADLLYFSWRNKCLRDPKSNKLNIRILSLVRYIVIILNKIAPIIVKVQVSHNILVERLWRKQRFIEPYGYIVFWDISYRIISRLSNLNVIIISNYGKRLKELLQELKPINKILYE